MRSSIFLLCILSGCFQLLLSKDPSQTLLTQFPILMSHDSASGEILEDNIEMAWTKTQSCGLVCQLNCGARAFDYRPYCQNGNIIAHHGGVVIDKPMSESIEEVMAWSNQNPNDLVIFYLSHFDGDSSCDSKSVSLLQQYGIYTVTNCNDLASMTMASAKSKSGIKGGGYVIGIKDCTNEEYDDTINCYISGQVCYDTETNKASTVPITRFSTYMQSVTTNYHSDTSQLWMAQAHWQSTAYSVSSGTLHNSSLLLDESRSGLNQWVINQIKGGSYKYLNIVEVDNVCDQGAELYNALNAFSLL